MSAIIHLDRPHAHFTNLDFITGKVVIQLSSETSIGGIQVKLEGESKTRLAGPRHGHNDQSDKKRTEMEVHKILYKVVTVFPTREIINPSSPVTSYTFAAGTYEYSFRFKFPFNNACSSHNSMLTNLNITGLKVEVARDTNRHVKKTLPPSLSGFPGEAEIKYYVKATIIRPQFYKENIRAFAGLNFLPIEPPRTGNPSEETYARRQHQFPKPNSAQTKKRGLFSKALTVSLQDTAWDPPRVSVDTRLPNPSILTCNEPIPLRILVKKLSESSETILLQMLQVELISYTQILAHDLARTESGSWVIMSRSNMAMPLGRESDAVGTEWTIDASMWNRIPLPNSVAPSFETCNIRRSYELEVRVGLSHGSVGDIKPQLIVLPLRMQVEVYSGITPPQALLDAMAAHRQPAKATNQPSKMEWPSDDTTERPPMPPRPANPPVPVVSGDDYDDAPPSYEDAIAESLSPVDGPRREYNPPAASSVRTANESVADVRYPVDSAKDHERPSVYNNNAANSSTETFDMLPSTPPESQSGTPPMSPVIRSMSTVKIRGGPASEDNPPQYQSIAQGQLQAPYHASDRRPSRSESRPMNLGVPNRKPVPRSSSSTGP